MIEVLILLYILINVYIVYVYFKKNLGIFQAPFLGSITSLGVFIPQLTTIYFSDHYDNRLLPNLLFMMISCNLAFTYAYARGAKSKLGVIRDIQMKESKWIFVVLGIIGLYASYSIRGVWMNTLEGGARTGFIIMVNLASYLELAFIYSLVYLVKFRVRDKIVISIIVMAGLLYLESIFLLGRRNLSLRLGLNLLFAMTLILPTTYRYTKYIILSLFIGGFIFNASIGTVRSNLKSSESSSGNIDYVQNFKDSFVQRDFSVGMDLGNAAIGIDYCYRNDVYDFGLDIWNDFVFNYVPRALFGEDLKKDLMVKLKYQELVKSLTHSVTTMTGYFDAFASFSYFGFLKFLLLGYIMGFIWVNSFYSTLYRLVYMFLFTQVSNVFTHSPQYIYARLEFLLLFFLPLLYFYIKKKNNIRKKEVIVDPLLLES